MHVERQINLPVPPEEAFRALARWEEQPKWMVDADRIEVVTEQREGVGVRLAVRTRIAGLPLFTDTLEVVEWDPPHRIGVAHRGLVRGTGTWELKAEGTGSRLKWIESVSIPLPLLGPAALAAYRPILRWLMGSSLRRLAATL